MKELKLTEKDKHNLYDLMHMIGSEYDETLKLNGMYDWFYNFFDRMEKVVVPELNVTAKFLLNLRANAFSNLVFMFPLVPLAKPESKTSLTYSYSFSPNRQDKSPIDTSQFIFVK